MIGGVITEPSDRLTSSPLKRKRDSEPVFRMTSLAPPRTATFRIFSRSMVEPAARRAGEECRDEPDEDRQAQEPQKAEGPGRRIAVADGRALFAEDRDVDRAAFFGVGL